MTTPNGVLAGAGSIAQRRERRSTFSATLRAIYIIWYRDVLRFWRDRSRLVAAFAQPILYLVIFGTGLSSALSGGGSFGGGGGQALNYTTFIYPGIIGMTVLFGSIFSAMSIVWDREFGFLKEVMVAPIDRSAVAIGKSLGGATQAMVQGLILLILAPIVGVKLTVMTVVILVPLTFVLAFALSALGVAIASRMKSMQGFQVVMNFLMMPIFFLSGALFPVGSSLPDWMKVLTAIDPAAYGIDPIRRVTLEGTVPKQFLDGMSLNFFGNVVPIWLEVVILLGFGVVALAVAVRNFRIRD